MWIETHLNCLINLNLASKLEETNGFEGDTRMYYLICVDPAGERVLLTASSNSAIIAFVFIAIKEAITQGQQIFDLREAVRNAEKLKDALML